MSADDHDARVRALLDQLSTEERAALTAGRDSWRIQGIERLGIGDLKVTDGPTGARGDLTTGARAVCFPVGSAIGATWDPDLVAEIATVLAAEARSKGSSVLLGPTVNIHRHPLAGRNFECYSEDPELTAAMARAFIGALQAQGIGASLKHFVGNDSEFERHSISSEIDEVTLREVYLRPFESAVATVDPWTIMGAYNRLNGTYACENRTLLVDILKQEWGWPGVLVSDWYATHDTVASGNGGLDLQMPGPALQFGPALADAVAAGEVDEATLADKAERILRLYARTGKLDQPGEDPETTIDTPERRALARRAAAAGTVLLTNGGALPLADALDRIAVIGPNATPGRIQGGGSSQVTPIHQVSPLDGIDARSTGTVTYHRGVGVGRYGAGPDPALLDGGGYRLETFATGDLTGEPLRRAEVAEVELSFFGEGIPDLGRGNFSARWTARLTPDATGTWRFGLSAAGRARLLVDGSPVVVDDDAGPKMSIWIDDLPTVTGAVELTSGRTVDVVVELRADERGVLPHLRMSCEGPDPDAELRRALDAAAAADVAIVVVGTSSDFETEGADRVDLALPGRQDELVRAVAEVAGRTIVVVNAGSPVAMPWADEVDAVLWTWYPGQEFGHALADVLWGDVDPGGRLPTTLPHRLEDTPAFTSYPGAFGRVRYGEGTFVGHRWYTARGIAPHFPFGHGLSYGTSSLRLLGVEPRTGAGTDGWTASVEITSTGQRPVTEVVQVYVDAAPGAVGRPVRTLAGFAKAVVEPGDSTVVEVHVPQRSLAHWDPTTGAWEVPEGTRRLHVARDAQSIVASAEVEVAAASLPTPQA